VQITTNEPFVRRRGLIGSLGTVLGFVVLALGMYVSIEQPSKPEISWLTFVPWITLAVGIIMLNVGKYYAMRYGTRPRVDVAITQVLKGLDNRNHLYNFVPTLPVEHLLVTPTGIAVLVPRPFFGDVIHSGDTWSRPVNFMAILQRFTDGGLGNPTHEALRDAEAVRNLLRERLGDDIGGSIGVSPVIVMFNPRVKLQVTDPEVPVVLVGDLKNAVRRVKEGGKLSSDVQKQIARALEWHSQNVSDDTQPSARGNAWQRTNK
jgi:hypothetical protein